MSHAVEHIPTTNTGAAMGETDTGAPRETAIRGVVEPLYRGRFWLQLIGVLSIIGGGLHGLATLVLLADGRVLALIPSLALATLFTWIGLLLLGAAGRFDRGYRDDDRRAVTEGMARLKTYFTVIGVLALIGLSLLVLGFLVALTMGIGQLMMI